MKRTLKKSTLIGFKIVPDQKRQLKTLARQQGQSLSAYLRDLALRELGRWALNVSTQEVGSRP